VIFGHFTLGQLVAWGAFLLLQNASFTFVSRARNSASYGLHVVAAMCSNGVWFAQNLISLGVILDVLYHGTRAQQIEVGAYYTACTVTGSVLMHWIGKRFIEKGRRRVGA
jgi:predicted Co/Zn/Cd cation transporter (cation efflux family)